MRILVFWTACLFTPIAVWAGPKVETRPMFSGGDRQYNHTLIVDLDNKITMNLVSDVDFNRFITDGRQRLFETKYSNALSTAKFGKSATVYLGERAKNPLPDSPRETHYMHITQLKEMVSDEGKAKDVLARKTGYKNQKINFRTNKNGLKMAVANYAHKNNQNYYFILIMGQPTYVINETYMVDPDSVVIER